MIIHDKLISCPCCGEKIKIRFDSSGNPTVFLLDKTTISCSELADQYGIEFGVLEGGDMENE